ncbi:TasA family protein [Nocardioides sp. zg-DK7169]|uniref:TasA family protein n=1 Tax=Nocardioides sp. zg-DK7169 TaxID=2736600 RepID=UPI0015574876|nr:TasA family protein [Nocardioides sp. zg-DK7169]NPC96630.1 hypothetical protein [Nocardioides sp. zg-DK7169]
MRKTTRPARRATATKVVASVALLAGAASVAGLGTFGAFTDTTTADQAVATGTVKLGMNSSISQDVAGLVPGDRIERQVKLTRAEGSETFGSLRLTTTATGDDILTAAATGLKLSVEQCSLPWIEVGKVLECKGTASNVVGTFLAPVDVLGQGRDLVTPLASVNAPGAAAHLRVTMSLPRTTADQNGLQGKAASVKFTFDAGQRDGEAR